METGSRAATTLAERAAAGLECAGPINGPRDQVAPDARGVRWVARINRPGLSPSPQVDGEAQSGRYQLWPLFGKATPLHRLIVLSPESREVRTPNEGLCKIWMRGCL